MLVALLAAAGIVLIVGAKDLAGRLVKGVIGAVLVLTALPCLVEFCARALSGRPNDSLSLAPGGLFLLVALAMIGFVVWRRRADRAKARDLWARRNGAPRTRALPAPPSTTGEGGS
jgi:NADH:ubiquinone oxidoreductase subunit 6 (subunit J)